MTPPVVDIGDPAEGQSVEVAIEQWRRHWTTAPIRMAGPTILRDDMLAMASDLGGRLRACGLIIGPIDASHGWATIVTMDRVYGRFADQRDDGYRETLAIGWDASARSLRVSGKIVQP